MQPTGKLYRFIALIAIWITFQAAGTPAFAQPESSIPLNNLGSAVIDGLLVQHLKITTKGL
mgnify:CR=1 FL=1